MTTAAPRPAYVVRRGPSLFVCGHGDWYVERADRPGRALVRLTADPLEVARLEALLNGRDRDRDRDPSPDPREDGP